MPTLVTPLIRKFVQDGVFYAEVNEFFTRELAEDGYAGVEIKTGTKKIEMTVRATKTANVLGEKGRRIREIQAALEKRFGFPKDKIAIFAERVNNRGLCAAAQAESLRYKLLGGLAVRRAANGVVRFIMESGAAGCEVIVSGKLRAQRAKSMKFIAGNILHAGKIAEIYSDRAVRHVMLRQGVLGIKIRIVLPYDPTGKDGVSIPPPKLITIMDPRVPDVSPSTVVEPQTIPGAHFATQQA